MFSPAQIAAHMQFLFQYGLCVWLRLGGDDLAFN